MSCFVWGMRSLPATILLATGLVAGVARAEDTPPVTVPPALEERPQADKDLETVIGRAIEDDQRVNAMQTKVAVKGGHVTLTGTARDVEEKEAAEALVRRVSGVRDVENQIQISRPGEPPPGTSMIPEVPAAH
jgi:osmotically-inducible protein OsmY